MQLSEIGSEFWDIPCGNRQYLLSGRTALDFIIRDIVKQNGANSVLLPSYCCHTMIEPFVRHNFRIRFYDVFFDEKTGLCADLPSLLENEVFYYMTYFGFSEITGIDIKEISKTRSVIIEDTTHSKMTDAREDFADYSYTSFRKWSGFFGIAEAVKKSGFFEIRPGVAGENYCNMRKKAMEQKSGFIIDGMGQKEEFLSDYNRAEELLETDYENYTPTAEGFAQLLTADFDFIKKQRKENADILLDGLCGINGLNLIYQERRAEETPLFVPVAVKGVRDELRKHLIENRIYCPVHWPLSDYHDQISSRARDIYGQELSLICDQRYGREEMEREVRLIRAFFNEGI